MTEESKENTAQENTEQESNPNPAEDVNDLLSTLNKLGVEEPKQLENMAFASKKAGQYASQFGDLKNQIAELQSQLKTQQAPQPRTDDGYYGNETVDLGNMVESKVAAAVGPAIRQTLGAMQEEHAKAQQEMYTQINEIQTDPDYGVVKQTWEQYVQNPTVAMALQSGTTTYKDEYNKVVRQFYRQLANRSKTVLETITQKGQPQAPHMEQGAPQQVPPETPMDDKTEKQKQIVESRKKGEISADDALAGIVEANLPGKDDPFWGM